MIGRMDAKKAFQIRSWLFGPKSRLSVPKSRLFSGKGTFFSVSILSFRNRSQTVSNSVATCTVSSKRLIFRQAQGNPLMRIAFNSSFAKIGLNMSNVCVRNSDHAQQILQQCACVEGNVMLHSYS